MTESLEAPIPFAEIKVDDSLSLRQLRPDEANILFELVEKDREYLGKWLPWVDSTKSLEDSREFINTTMQKRLEGSEYGYGMILDGKIVGHTSIMHVTDGKDPEIGYWIASNESGKGLTTKAATALTEFGFNQLGLPKIVLKAKPDNIPSNAVAGKLGYTLTGQEDDPIHGIVNVWSLER